MAKKVYIKSEDNLQIDKKSFPITSEYKPSFLIYKELLEINKKRAVIAY